MSYLTENHLVAANSEVVDLGLLPVPNIVGAERFAHFTIRGRREDNNRFRGEEERGGILEGIFRVPP